MNEVRKAIVGKDQKSNEIIKKIINMDEFYDCETIAIFAPFRGEIDLLCLLDTDKQVVFPKVINNNSMSFHEVESVNDLSVGFKSILEPVNNDIIEKDEIDIIFVPGLAFTTSGERIGYGGGYYDRYLQNFKGLKIGVCYQEQIVDHIKTREFDIVMDKVITSSRSD